MTNKKAGSQEISLLAGELKKSHLLRLATLADIIDRFVDIQLKNKVNWLKTFSLAVLIYNGGTITPSQMGRIMHRSNDSMTKLVDSLVRDGWVRRRRGDKDRRNVQIVLTESGLSAMKGIIADIETIDGSLESSMSTDEMDRTESVVVSLKEWLCGKLDVIEGNGFTPKA